MRKRLVLIFTFMVFAGFGLPMTAIGQAKSSPKVPTQKAVDWMTADDPRATFRTMLDLYKNLPQDTSRPIQIKVLNYILMSGTQASAHDELQTMKTEFFKAMDDAKSLKLYEESLYLGLHWADVLKNQEKNEQAFTQYAEILTAARSLGNPEILLQVLTNYAVELVNVGRKSRAYEMLHEAEALAADRSLNIDPLHRNAALVSAALAVEGDAQGQMDQVIEHGMEFFRGAKVRNYVSILSFNIGLAFLNRKPPDYKKSRAYLEESLAAAQDLKDQAGIAAALTTISRIDIDEGHFQKSQDAATQAEEIMDPRNKLWRSISLAQKARASWNLGQNDAALRYAEQALQGMPEDYVEQRAGLYYMKARILEEKGQAAEALKWQKVYHDLQMSAALGMEEKRFAEAKAQLGLQMEQQKNQLLQKENELQASMLQSAQRLRQALIGLALLLLGSLVSTAWAIFNARRITRAQEKVQRILDLIEEGILTINHKLELEPEYSQYLSQLYPALLQSSGDAVSLLFPEQLVGSENQSMIRESLRASLDEEWFTWELNAAHRPSELVLPGATPKVLHILWQPVLDHHNKIRSFLLSLRDVSTQKSLEREVHAQQRKVEDMQVRMQELLLTPLTEAKRLLDALGNEKELQGTQEISQALIRRMHTYKGEARTLGLRFLSQAIHNWESTRTSSASSGSLVHQEVETYQTLLLKVFGSAKAHAPAQESLVDILGPIIIAIKAQVAEAGLEWGAFDILDRVSIWPQSILRALRENLMHALTNSADHAYILPLKQATQRTPTMFRIEAQQVSNDIVVLVRDFGVGLNRQALEALAEKRGYSPAAGETWVDVVFQDGISTAAETSLTSGRGLGLAAIRASCRALGGDAHLQPNDQGSGTVLVMNFACPDSLPSFT